MTKRKYNYLLGDSKVEAERLKRQSRVWDPIAHALFDRLGVKPGWKVLEVGPGRGSLHLELRRRVRGPIDAVERSPVFAETLAAACKRDRLGEGQRWTCDLMDAELPRGHYDLIFARWVFLFLPQPREHIRKLARALKPGGLLAIEDYHRETLALLPKLDHWDDFMIADRKFFASEGGDVSIASKLPGYFEEAGLKTIDIRPNFKTGNPGSDVWGWVSDYFLGILDRYAQHPPLTPEKTRAIRSQWLRAAKRPTSVLIGPTVVDVVGRKPK